MYEAAEEENPSIHSKPRKQSPSYSLMDLDIDFDPSWPSNQNPFLCDPSSPLLLSLASSPLNPNTLSLSEQPCSPLWAFSDGGDEENSGGKERPSFGAALRFFQRPKYLSCNSDPLSRSFTGEEEKRRFFSTSMGLAHMEIPDGSCLIKERMMQALRYFKETMEQQVLAQVWAPVKNGDRYVLTTSEQPFVLDPQSNGLLQYRTVSLNYMFSVDGESDGDLGLPGRVFLQKLPEWTPNVQYYSTKEYPRLKHALQFDVRGTLALPVIEPSEQSCIGVVELIMTSHKIKYATEVDKVCKALEAVNLKSSEILDHPSSQICNEGRQTALVEILEILTVVCETHKLPLAQTWVPCRHRRVLAYGGGVKKSCTSFDGNCMGQVCMSTTDVAYYVVDAHMLGFRGACLEHHLQKEQGAAGRAFSSQGLCFSSDVTQFSKNQYPLVHYARMFGLAGCFAICLQSRHTGTDDYILEFFLPPNITDMKEQQVFLDSLLATMNQHFRSLKVASGNQLIDERYIEIVGTSVSENLDSNFQSVQISGAQSPPRPNGLSDKGFNIQSDFLEQQLMVETDDLGKGDKLVHINGNHPTVVSNNKGTGKTTEKKRGKSEKSISLKVLQQYFAGSLKDAAKSLGVCPTTMKRICRQHGISRWPSRKINKVNRSLTKLQRVIESVHGAEGAFNLTSLAASPLPVPVGSISWPVCLNGLKEQNSSGPKLSELQGARTDAPAIVTPESDAQGYMRNQIHEGGDFLALQELVHKPNESSLENSNGSTRFKVRSGSAEESTETPTSHGSCQGSPADVTMPANASHPSIQEQIENIGSSFFLEFQPNPEMNFSTACAILDAPITEETQLPLGGMLVDDAGSSKDLINLSNCHMDKQDRESSWRNPPCPEKSPEQEIAAPIHAMVHTTGSQGMRSVTMKVGYKEDIIRFRLSLTSGLIDLKEEVAKRFKLEVGTFDIKYSDDDSEWVLLACDADLQECMDTWSLSGKHIIRLSAHDIVANLGSSCESTVEWREK